MYEMLVYLNLVSFLHIYIYHKLLFIFLEGLETLGGNTL